MENNTNLSKLTIYQIDNMPEVYKPMSIEEQMARKGGKLITVGIVVTYMTLTGKTSTIVISGSSIAALASTAKTFIAGGTLVALSRSCNVNVNINLCFNTLFDQITGNGNGYGGDGYDGGGGYGGDGYGGGDWTTCFFQQKSFPPGQGCFCC